MTTIGPNDYDGHDFFEFWQALKVSISTMNVNGGGVGEVRTVVGFARPHVDPLLVEVPDTSPIDIVNAHAALTISYSEKRGYSTKPTVLFTLTLGNGTEVMEREEVPLPDLLDNETVKERTARWIGQIEAKLDEALTASNLTLWFSDRRAAVLQPVLDKLLGSADPTTTHPDWPM